MSPTWTLDPNRIFSPEPARRSLARDLYDGVKDLPLICPHGHVPPALLAGRGRYRRHEVLGGAIARGLARAGAKVGVLGRHREKPRPP